MGARPSSPWAFAKTLLHRHRSLASNAAGLYLDTLTSYLFPLLTLPYLVRTLTPRGYGTIAFAQSLVTSLATLVDYASNLTATRKAATLRDEPGALSRLLGQVLAARTLVCLLAVGVLGALCSSVRPVAEAAPVVGVLAVLLVAQAWSPAFLYLGLERMAELAKLNLVINLAALGAIFALVRSENDTVVLAAILAAGPLTGSLAGLAWASRRWGVRPVFVSWSEAKSFLREGWPLFLSSAAMTAYTVANPFLLGLFASKQAVAFYAGAEKIVRALLRALSPLTQALFPRMVRVAQEGVAALYRKARQVLAAFCAVGALSGLLLASTATWIVRLLLGPQFAPSAAVLRVLSLMLPLVAASNVLGVQVLLPLRRDQAFTAIVVAASGINVALAVALAPSLGERGMAAAVVASELFVTVAMLAAVARARPTPGDKAW